MKKLASAILASLFLFTACHSGPDNDGSHGMVNDPLLWKKTASIYEVNIRQHTAEGTIKAFTEDLERIADMGIQILWIMPVQPIGEKNRKGELGSYYSISDYTAVNPDYGTVEDFQIMVDKAHSLGMKVILDWVANHTAFDHQWTVDHLDYYNLTQDSLGNDVPSVALDNDGGVTDWTDVADLNYDNPEMRTAMIDEMLWWISECNIDGFRCDVAGFVPHDFWQTAIAKLKEKKDVFMLAEWGEPYLLDVFDMMYGWHFHHLTNEVAKSHKDHSAENATDEETNQAIKNTEAHDMGQPVSVFDDYLAETDTTYPEDGMVMLFTTNHDENSWNGTVYERYGDGHKAFFVLSSTFEDGMPLVYSGQEAGLNHRLSFFGKDTVRWENKGLEAFYSTAIKTKTANPALWNAPWGGNQEKVVTTADDKVYAFTRRRSGNDVVVFINLSPDPVSFDYEGIPVNTYEEAYSGNIVDLGGPGSMELEPWGYMVFSNNLTATE